MMAIPWHLCVAELEGGGWIVQMYSPEVTAHPTVPQSILPPHVSLHRWMSSYAVKRFYRDVESMYGRDRSDFFAYDDEWGMWLSKDLATLPFTIGVAQPDQNNPKRFFRDFEGEALGLFRSVQDIANDATGNAEHAVDDPHITSLVV